MNKKHIGGVTIGNISGGIHESVIAGQDVSDVTIKVGGRPVAANKQPNADELRKLLLEIQKELAEFAAQKEILGQVTPGAAAMAESAEASVRDAADKIQPIVEPGDAVSIQTRLSEAVSQTTTLLDVLKGAAEKGGEAAEVIQPIVKKALPLIKRLGVAALWAAKLWLPV